MQRKLITYLWIACEKPNGFRMKVEIIFSRGHSGSATMFPRLTSSPYFTLFHSLWPRKMPVMCFEYTCIKNALIRGAIGYLFSCKTKLSRLS